MVLLLYYHSVVFFQTNIIYLSSQLSYKTRWTVLSTRNWRAAIRGKIVNESINCSWLIWKQYLRMHYISLCSAFLIIWLTLWPVRTYPSQISSISSKGARRKKTWKFKFVQLAAYSAMTTYLKLSLPDHFSFYYTASFFTWFASNKENKEESMQLCIIPIA